MGTKTLDYRISMIAVHCKDCGQDAGLYPARHRCQQVMRPPLPSLPLLCDTGEKKSKGTDQTQEDDSIYFDSFAAHLPEVKEPRRSDSLRDKLSWKQKVFGLSRSKTTSEYFWSPSKETSQFRFSPKEEEEPDSDGSDWEGETHVSRILREYHEKKHNRLPDWIRGPPPEPLASDNHREPSLYRSVSQRRLWEPPTADIRYTRREQAPSLSRASTLSSFRPHQNMEPSRATRLHHPQQMTRSQQSDYGYDMPQTSSRHRAMLWRSTSERQGISAYKRGQH